MALILVTSADLPAGSKLSWPVYDVDGHMLLKRGTQVSASQRAGLLSRGIYRDTNDEASASHRAKRVADGGPPFERLDALIQRTSATFGALFAAEPASGERIARLVADLRALYAEHPDAMLAAVHLVHDRDYSLCHPLHCAILCELLARCLGYPAERTASLLAAALTQNIGMINLQETLQKQASPLSAAQAEALRRHPEHGVELLQAAGVADEAWLAAMRQHHERLDGSGYPAGLSGTAIGQDPRLLALADRYAALVSARSYRAALPAQLALKQLYLQREQLCGAELAQTFIHAIGVYPPGSFVKLSNGETALVIQRGQEALRPLVASYRAPNGAPYPRPFRRDSRQSQYRIATQQRPDHSIPLNLAALWPA